MILLTADFLAEKYVGFSYHAAGILPVLESAVACLGLDTTYVFGQSYSDPADLAFDPLTFFAYSGMEYESNGYPPLADVAELSAESLEYFGKFAAKFSLIVGYELSDFTVALLERFGARYVNVWLHPVRFMDDEIFLVTSNVPSVRERLPEYAISEDSFFVNARYAKAVINRRHEKNRLDIKPPSCVFFGQIPWDKTLRRKGGYISVDDYADDLRRIAGAFPNLYYCRHPLLRTDDEFRALKKIFGNARTVAANGYRLIGCDAVGLVVTISSSIGIEAYYFGKNVLYLNKPSVDIRRPGAFAVDASLFDPGVLADLLDAPRPRPGKFMFRPRNKVRNLLDAYYSYPILKDHYDGK